MEPGLQAKGGVRSVPEIGRGDDDRVEPLFLREHVLDVGICLDLEPGLAEAVLPVGAAEGPDVADRAEIQPGNAEHRVEQHAALDAEADDRDL